MSTVNTVTEQLTRAGQAIEHDSFAIIDAEVQGHSYTPEQWPIVRRMIHANADFDFNGLTDFHPQAVQVGIRAMLRGGTPVVADVERSARACRCRAWRTLAWSRTSSFRTPT